MNRWKTIVVALAVTLPTGVLPAAAITRHGRPIHGPPDRER